MSNRIIINIRDGITDQEAVENVLEVIKIGKISKIKNKDQYCFSTVFNCGNVVSAKYKYNIKADSFIVHKDKNNGIKKWEN